MFNPERLHGLTPALFPLLGTPEIEILEAKLGLDDTGGLDSGAQYVLLCGDVARGDQTFQVIQVTAQAQRECMRCLPVLKAQKTGWVLRPPRGGTSGTRCQLGAESPWSRSCLCMSAPAVFSSNRAFG